MKIKSIIIAILLLTASTCNAGFFDWLGFGDNVGGGMGTLEMLNQWRSTTDGITTNSSGKTIYTPLSDAYFANLTVGGIATTTTLCFADNTCQTTAVGALTPWTENIDGGGFNLTNVGYISADTGTSTISNLNVTGDLTVGANIYGSFTFVTSGDLQVDNIKLSGNTIEATNDSGLNIFDNASNGITVKDGGNVGIGTTAPDGTLHVHTATAGSITPNVGADDLIVENSESGGISILVPDASVSNLYFGTPTDIVGARIRWDHTNDLMSFGTTHSGSELSLMSADTVEAMRIDSAGNVGIGTTAPTVELDVVGDIYASGDVSALTFSDRTPYPKDLEIAYKSVLSMMRLPEGEYDEGNKEFQLDHSKLTDFIKSGDGRDLSATVSAQNEVIKDLIKRINELTKRIEVLEKR